MSFFEAAVCAATFETVSACGSLYFRENGISLSEKKALECPRELRMR
jgi:hypothetical protein